MDDANPPPKMWRVEVFSGLDRIIRYDLPMHRLDDKSVFPFLKALVLKYEDLTPIEFIGAMLNKRKGGPLGLVIEKLPQRIDIERERISYTALGPTITAMIYWRMSKQATDTLRHIGKL